MPSHVPETLASYVLTYLWVRVALISPWCELSGSELPGVDGWAVRDVHALDMGGDPVDTLFYLLRRRQGPAPGAVSR